MNRHKQGKKRAILFIENSIAEFIFHHRVIMFRNSCVSKNFASYLIEEIFILEGCTIWDNV